MEATICNSQDKILDFGDWEEIAEIGLCISRQQRNICSNVANSCKPLLSLAILPIVFSGRRHASLAAHIKFMLGVMGSWRREETCLFEARSAAAGNALH